MTSAIRRRLTAVLAAFLVGILAGCTDGTAATTSSTQAPTTTDAASTTPSDPAAPSPAPVDRARELGLAGAPGYGRAVSLVDLDGDGWEDVYLSDSDARLRGAEFGRSRVLRNVEGRFEPWDIGLRDEDVFANGGSAFGDADGDGDPDLLVVNGNNSARSRLAYYENRLDEDGKFVQRTRAAGIPTEDQAWWGVAWFDSDLDGDLDLIVTGSRTALLINDGSGSFRDRTEASGLGQWLLDPIHKNPVVLDLDGDGAPDLASGGGSPAVLYRNDGRGNYTDVTDSALPDDLPDFFWTAGFAAAADDLNQDGHDDLYLGRFWYQDYVLLNRGDGTFEAHSTDIGLRTITYDESVPFFGGQVPQQARSTSPTTPTTWQWSGDYTTGVSESENTMGLTVGDLDDDGVPDVIIGTGDPSAANPDIVFCGTAAGDGGLSYRRCRTDLTDAQGPTRGHGFALGDLNRDGATDLLTNPGGWTAFDAERQVDTREFPHLYLGVRKDDLPVARLELLQNGRTAFGARVAVPGPITRYRTVRWNQGFQSSMSSVAVQVRSAAPVEVVVRWPGGGETTHRVEPGRDQTIEGPALG
jgi:hypothetical protein